MYSVGVLLTPDRGLWPMVLLADLPDLWAHSYPESILRMIIYQLFTFCSDFYGIELSVCYCFIAIAGWQLSEYTVIR